MLSIACQKCRQPLAYTSAQAGKPIPCPHCGTFNMLPPEAASLAAVAVPTPGDTARTRGLPAALETEAPVMVVYPAMFASKPFSFLILWLATLGGFGFAVFFAVTAVYPAAITCAAVAVLCLSTLFFWRIARRSRRIEITTRRIFDKQGLFSKRVNEIRIQDIRDMKVVQSFGERALGVGRLSISTAGQSDYEIEIADIPSPHKVREAIDQYRRL